MRDLGLLAAQVRAVRGLLGWSQAYLAEGINARRATITDFENGKHELREAIEPVAMIRYPPLKPELAGRIANQITASSFLISLQKLGESRQRAPDRAAVACNRGSQNSAQ